MSPLAPSPAATTPTAPASGAARSQRGSNPAIVLRGHGSAGSATSPPLSRCGWVGLAAGESGRAERTSVAPAHSATAMHAASRTAFGWNTKPVTAAITAIAPYSERSSQP